MNNNFILLISKTGAVRLQHFHNQSYSKQDQELIIKHTISHIIPRDPKDCCNVIQYMDFKIVYRRYASLFFALGVPLQKNELIALEEIHLFVESLDLYFSNVCELDLIYNFHKAYSILFDTFGACGLLQSTNKKDIKQAVADMDQICCEGMGEASDKIEPLPKHIQVQLGRREWEIMRRWWGGWGDD